MASQVQLLFPFYCCANASTCAVNRACPCSSSSSCPWPLLFLTSRLLFLSLSALFWSLNPEHIKDGSERWLSVSYWSSRVSWRWSLRFCKQIVWYLARQHIQIGSMYQIYNPSHSRCTLSPLSTLPHPFALPCAWAWDNKHCNSVAWTDPSHLVCFPFTEPGLCLNRLNT